MTNALKIRGFDHLELAVADLDQGAQPFLRLGFEKAGTREIRERGLRSVLLIQNDIALLLSTSTLSGDPIRRFLELHGPGVCHVGFRCDDAIHAFQTLVNKGAEPLLPPKTIVKDYGSVEFASVKVYEDISFAFLAREGNIFHEGFSSPFRQSNSGVGLKSIEHLALNVEAGGLEKVAHFLEKYMDFDRKKISDWSGDSVEGHSAAWLCPGTELRILVNEASSSLPRVEEYLKIHHGSGWQHMGLLSDNLLTTMKTLRKEAVAFIPTPPAYYEALLERVPSLLENINELEVLQLQVDNDPFGYLLQAYSTPLLGAFFVEFLERRGAKSLGSESYRAWENATRREPQRAGVHAHSPAEGAS